MKRYLILLVLTSFTWSSAHAQKASTTEALPFLQLDFNHSSLAMGSTITPTAALVPAKDYSIAGGVGYTSYMPKLDGTKYISAGASGKLGKFGFSLAGVRGTGAEITGEEFKPYELIINAGAGYAINGYLSLGVNVKYGKEQILKDYSNSAAAADIFAAGFYKGFELSAGVSNLGGKIASESTGDFSLPAAFTLAGNYMKVAAGVHHLEARFKIDNYFSGSTGVSVGAQYGYAGLVYVRGGYHYGGETIIPTFASAGLGLHLYNITIDAVCLFASETLQDSFGLSLGVEF